MKIKLTDEEAITEFKTFYNNIDKVTVTMRHYFWVTQFILVMIAITMIYFFSFAQFWEASANFNPLSQETANRVIFIAFFAGCYTDIVTNNYFKDISPFYAVLVLLIIEKLA